MCLFLKPYKSIFWLSTGPKHCLVLGIVWEMWKTQKSSNFMHFNVAWHIIHKHYSYRVRPENAVKKVKSRESQENDEYICLRCLRMPLKLCNQAGFTSLMKPSFFTARKVYIPGCIKKPQKTLQYNIIFQHFSSLCFFWTISTSVLIVTRCVSLVFTLSTPQVPSFQLL